MFRKKRFGWIPISSSLVALANTDCVVTERSGLNIFVRSLGDLLRSLSSSQADRSALS
jgi:hypothetical protein